MNSDNIKRIEIDEDGKLHLVTEEEKFTLIYRTATEVHWDPAKHSLYSPKPRDWSYLQWWLFRSDGATCFGQTVPL